MALDLPSCLFLLVLLLAGFLLLQGWLRHLINCKILQWVKYNKEEPEVALLGFFFLSNLNRDKSVFGVHKGDKDTSCLSSSPSADLPERQEVGLDGQLVRDYIK